MKKRLDILVYEKGFAESREKAKAIIMAGLVYVDNQKADKCGTSYDENVSLEVRGSVLPYVSRGGLKLEKAIKNFDLDLSGKTAMDIGASTGGFTDCLLQHGARRVYAIDSGTGQLHPSLKENSCVVSMENTNARFLDESMVPITHLVVMDVSFISQSLLYPAVAKVLAPGGIYISLIKPQFEVGREGIGSGGIVKSEKLRLDCIETLKKAGEKYGLIMKQTITSPITGGDGNTEYLALFQKEPKEK